MLWSVATAARMQGEERKREWKKHPSPAQGRPGELCLVARAPARSRLLQPAHRGMGAGCHTLLLPHGGNSQWAYCC